MTQDAKDKAAAMHEATDIGTKLTKPQRVFLERLDRGEGQTVNDRIINALVDRGVIDYRSEITLRGETLRHTISVDLTEAGRSLLRSLQEKSNG